MKKPSIKFEKQNFKPRKMSAVEREAARKASIDKEPQMPNRDLSMRISQT